jgi:hypothetical protein
LTASAAAVLASVSLAVGSFSMTCTSRSAAFLRQHTHMVTISFIPYLRKYKTNLVEKSIFCPYSLLKSAKMPIANFV